MRHYRLLKRAYWKIVGSPFERRAVPSDPRSVLFICKGNICRSAFAEGYSRSLMTSMPGLSECLFSSAGLDVVITASTPLIAQKVAHRFHIDLGVHQSKSINDAMIASSDMTVAMEAKDAWRLCRLYPRFARRIFLLPIFEGRPGADLYCRYNIPDPYGRPEEEFVTCFTRIERAIDNMFGAYRGS